MIHRRAVTRAAAATAAGAVVALVLALAVGTTPLLAGVLGWAGLATSYAALTWHRLSRMSPDETARHATTRESGRRTTHLVLGLAALASLGGVGVLLAAGDAGKGVPVEALAGTAAVAASWVLIHLIFTMRYARAYFEDPADEPVDFNATERPDYQDFAYLAYTIGMCYQVSDTAIGTRGVRRLALRHAVLSYFLGAVVVGSTINLVVQLASTTLSH